MTVFLTLLCVLIFITGLLVLAVGLCKAASTADRIFRDELGDR